MSNGTMLPPRARSATTQTARLPPIPSTIPYISLPDRHLSDYFTKERIRKHLLQAGLLTKDGRIVSEAEYQSKQTDVAIGRENHRKRDEAILEVLNEMGEEHNKQTNRRLETIKNDLLHQLRHIEEQYSRRVQPISITITHEGRVEQKPIIREDVSRSRLQPSPGSKTDRPRVQPMIATPNLSNELDSIRQKLEELIHNQSILDRRLNTLSTNNKGNALLWTIQHSMTQLQEKQNNVEKQQETSQQTREDEEKKRTGERKIIELITRDVADKFQRLEDQLAKLKALPTPITRAEVENLIRNAIQTLKPTQQNNSELDTLIQVMNDKIAQLEKRLNDLSPSTGSYVTRPAVDDLIRQAISNKQPTPSKTIVTPQLDIDLEKRITSVEQRLDTFPPVPDLRPIEHRLAQLENQPDDRIRHERLVGIAPPPSLVESPTTNTVYAEDPRIPTLQNQVNDHTSFLQNLHIEINELKQTKTDIPAVNQLLDMSEEKTRQAMSDLARYVHRECRDDRVPGVIDELRHHSTEIQNLANQINGLDQNKPGVQTVKELIRESEGRIVNALTPGAGGDGRPDPRIPDLQTQIDGHSGAIQNLNKQLDQLRQEKSDLRVVQQLIGESEQRIKSDTNNFPLPILQPLQDPRVSDILQQIDGHKAAIQDLNNRINQLPNPEPNDDLLRKVNANENEVKKVRTDLAALRRQLDQQPTSKSQPPPPPSPPNKDSPTRQYTDEEFQAIMPFIELLPVFDLFAEDEWD